VPDEDADAEYRQNDHDLKAAGYRKIRDPRGGWSWIRTYPDREGDTW